MPICLEYPMLSTIVDDLANRGWSRQPFFLPEALISALAAECRHRAAEGELSPAGVGRGTGQEVREAIRGDRIQWLEPGESEACDRYLTAMDSLRQALNQGLYLGLEDFECHFALYPPGAFYRRHVDRFRDDDRRAVSAILYLNENWQPQDGGQLRMFLAEDAQLDVQPEAGSLVVFLSGDIPHEVLPARRDRLSLTGWFRRRGNEPF
ncbi:2OG-Fe(II) oxygenase [Pseudomonas guariconensis]|uniref:2OG-Fe(II) oxygenase n=1 Tax=Pseudomonas guariconensis TaxID=1288410 RepID=A0AAX0VYS3_9PSED|nr:2OG-Fe(II) oxygenase [Pseudomonas guariconensis]PLV19840.1 2OG-Fe(II) oxygenase [Pseudomonas guariconensis]PLV24450.1 2OG-Fe(II) oxygenase [Pseudomonas guariconensis]PLV29473.1 2OG-Fe(II) oxygenase [Pseudomonas guariconensis]